MSSLLECPFCKKTLDKPVILPCGHSICKKHEQTNTETSKISCPTCYIDHNIPKNSAGFVSNLLVESLLEHKLAKLDLGPEHRLANESLKDLGEIIDEFKRIRAHPDLEIDRVVTELKFKIDLKREVGKKANDDSLQLISDLDKYIKDCKENLGSDGFVVSARIDELIESVEKKIPIWTREMNMFERNVKKWRKIQEEAVKSYDKLRRECDRVGKIVFNDRFDEIVVRQKIYCEERIMEPLMKLELNISGFDRFVSDFYEQFGVKWYISAYTGSYDDDTGDEYLSVYLNSKHDNININFQVDADLVIENKINPEKSPTKNIKFVFKSTNCTEGFTNFI